MQIYEVAFFLGTPVYRISNEMPYDELLGWLDYFERRPVGWRDDRRAAYVIQSNGSKVKAETLFPSLAQINRPADDPMENFKASHMFSKILTARGGDKLDL